MYQEDFFDTLAQGFPTLCSPERVEAVKQRLSMGRDSKLEILSPVDDDDMENRENVLPQRMMTPALEQSAKKAKKNRAKKARRQANQALREAHEQYIRRIFVSRDEKDCAQAVQDALAVLQETEGVLNEQVLRRLSVEKFTSDSLRRLSACKLEPLSAAEDALALSAETTSNSEQIDVVEALRNYVSLVDIMEEAAIADEPMPQKPETDHRCNEKNHDRRRRRELMNEVYDDELVYADFAMSQAEPSVLLTADVFRECLENRSLALHVQEHTITPTHVEYVIQVMVLMLHS